MTGTGSGRRVLHLLHSWGVPSHTFVRAGVSGVPGYQAVVVCERNEAQTVPSMPVHTLGWADRLPRGLAGKARVLATARYAVASALVHAHFAHQLVLADRVASLTRRPWVASLHGHDALVELPGTDGAPGRAALRRAALVTVPSEFLAEHARGLGVPTDRVVVAPSGVDLDELAFQERSRHADEPTKVLFVGRFVDKKGVLDAADAVVAAASSAPLRARFVGGGPLERELRARLAPLDRQAEVVDGTARAVVLRALADAHVLISPSRTAPDGDADTLLMVNLEAQACGLPVITTRHGGIPSALDPTAAVLVPEGDTPALGIALADLAGHPERWGEMGRAGRAFVQAGFTLDHAGRRMAALYDRVIPSLRGA